MATINVSTNALLDLCRFGKSLKNEAVDTAVTELVSWIVFSSLLERTTELNEELQKRVAILQDAQVNRDKYPQDIFEDEESEEQETPDGDGPQVA